MARKIEKICEQCQNTYIGFAKEKTRKYCSRKCAAEAKKRTHPYGKHSPEALAEYLSCDFDTGILYWKKSPAPQIKTGAVAGGSPVRGYLRVFFNGKFFLAHRVVWTLYHKEWPTQQLDHISGVRADNGIKNLRLATLSQQCQNRKQLSGTFSGVKGVRWNNRNKKWVVLITVNKKRVHLGYHTDKEEAIKVRKAAEEKYFGEFNRKAA